MSENSISFITSNVSMDGLWTLGCFIRHDIIFGVLGYTIDFPTGWSCKPIESDNTCWYVAVYTPKNEHILLLRTLGKDNFAQLDYENKELFEKMVHDETINLGSDQLLQRKNAKDLQSVNDKFFRNNYEHNLKIARLEKKIDYWKYQRDKACQRIQSEKHRADMLLKMLNDERRNVESSQSQFFTQLKSLIKRKQRLLNCRFLFFGVFIFLGLLFLLACFCCAYVDRKIKSSFP